MIITVKEIVNLNIDCEVVEIYQNGKTIELNEDSLMLPVDTFSLTICDHYCKLCIKLL